MTNFPCGCLGKLPLHGDFIRYNAAGAEVQEFDTWIQEGIYQGYQELDSKWDASFDAAPVSRFVYCSPRTKRIVAGLLKPSADKVGRRYPFLLYTIIEPGALGNDSAYIPWALEPFLQRAKELADWSDSAISLNSFLSSFDSLRFELDWTEARKAFAKFVLARSAGDYWAGAFGRADDERRYAAVQLTSWAVDTRPPESTTIRYPVTEPEGEAAFWLDLARRFGGNNLLPTLAVWTGDASAAAPRLHLMFGKLSSACFLPLVLPERPSPAVKDLAAMTQVDANMVDRARSQFEEVLSEPSLKLSDLLQRLPRARA